MSRLKDYSLALCDRFKSKNKCLKINNVKFYYDPDEIEITEDIKKYLKQFNGDRAYSVYIDESVGLVVY